MIECLAFQLHFAIRLIVTETMNHNAGWTVELHKEIVCWVDETLAKLTIQKLIAR